MIFATQNEDLPHGADGRKAWQKSFFRRKRS